MATAVITFRRAELVDGEPFSEYQYTFEVGSGQAQAVVTVWEKTKGGPLRMGRARQAMRQLAVEMIETIDREAQEETTSSSEA